MFVSFLLLSICALVGCRGEQICAGEVAEADGDGLASCKLKADRSYEVVLQAKDVHDDNDEDHWSVRVKGVLKGPNDSVVQTFQGGDGNNEGTLEYESGSTETLTFDLQDVVPAASGPHRLVLQDVAAKGSPPEDKIEVAILKDS